MTQTSRELVLAKLMDCFPKKDIAAQALVLLDTYGTKSYHQEQSRVQLAILKLSEGDMEKLRRYTEAANQDYRDVLAWAEYPKEMKAFYQNLSSDAMYKIRKEDRQQYLDWLNA